MEMVYKYWPWFAMMILDFMILKLQQKLNQQKKKINYIKKSTNACVITK